MVHEDGRFIRTEEASLPINDVIAAYIRRGKFATLGR